MLVLGCLSASYAQPDSAWLFRYPGSEPLAFFADDTGNVYVAGWSEPSEDRLDVLLLKADSLGHLLWAKTYDHATAAGAARDRSGDIHITGNSNGAGRGRLLVLKYKPGGDTGWVRTYGEAGKEYGALGSIAIDDSQNVYVCGAAESSSCTALRILRYRPDGVPSAMMSHALDTSMQFWSGTFNRVHSHGPGI